MKRVEQHPHVYAFLQKNHTGVLSTVSDDKKPWGSAVYFIVDEDFNIFFITRKQTHKYRNIASNSQAALTVVDEVAQTTVQLAGEVTPVPPEDYMDIVFDKLSAVQAAAGKQWAPPLGKVHKGDYMPLRLTPTKLQYADYREPVRNLEQEYIQDII